MKNKGNYKKKLKSGLLIITLLITTLPSCSSKKIEQSTIINPANNYKEDLCLWLKPYYAVDGNFEEQVPAEVLKMMLRSDNEFNNVCLK
jgi:hypothetical protein